MSESGPSSQDDSDALNEQMVCNLQKENSRKTVFEIFTQALRIVEIQTSYVNVNNNDNCNLLLYD